VGVAPGHQRIAEQPSAWKSDDGTPVAVAVAPRTIVLIVGVAVGCLLLLALAWATRAVLIQLIVAIVLAMAAEPLVQVFERRGLRRGAAVGISFAIAAVTLAAFAYLLLAPIAHETQHFIHDEPRVLQELEQGQGQFGFLEERFHVVERTQSAIGSRPATEIAGPVVDVAGSAVRTGGAIFFIAFLTLFVQLGGRQWFDSLVGLAPEESRVRLRRAGSGISGAVGGYVSGNLLISVICGAVTTVVLLAASVPYAVPLGLIVAIFDLIPMIGATLGTVLVAAVALTRGIPTTAVVVAAMWLYQKVENHWLQQLVYHRTVKLSPLAVSVSIAAGAELGGVVGALLGIPFAGALKVVSREAIAWRRGDDAPA
jgi:predicted PurR-regulated permease PerM